MDYVLLCIYAYIHMQSQHISDVYIVNVIIHDKVGVPIPTQGRVSLKGRFLERSVATLIEFPSNFPLSPLGLPRHATSEDCFVFR
jgi:hypothetical protein